MVAGAGAWRAQRRIAIDRQPVTALAQRPSAIAVVGRRFAANQQQVLRVLAVDRRPSAPPPRGPPRPSRSAAQPARTAAKASPRVVEGELRPDGSDPRAQAASAQREQRASISAASTARVS